MDREITRSKAEAIIVFAEKHNALVESREFAKYDRHIISTPDGTVALKAMKDDSKYWLSNFHGMDNKLVSIVDKGAIKLAGYCYI